MTRSHDLAYPDVSDNVAKAVEELQPWFHNLHLPDGTQTAPEHFLGDFPAYKWAELAPLLPESLHGWNALDIGCNAGFYSFELARRGAYVTAIDSNSHYLRQARWAARQYELDQRIEFRNMQVYDLARTAERYDLVLFLGVFYHLRYPLLGLDIVTQKVRRLLCFQTLTMPGEEVFAATADRHMDERELMRDPGWPKMAFIEHRFAEDPTNWWAPNHAAVEAMLRSSGMRVSARPGHEVYVCMPDPEQRGVQAGWNRDEYDAALGRDDGSPRRLR